MKISIEDAKLPQHLWEGFVCEILQSIVTSPLKLFYSPINNGTWINASEAFIADKDVPEIVTATLRSASVHVLDDRYVNPYVLSFLTCSREEFQELANFQPLLNRVSPALLRQALRQRYETCKFKVQYSEVGGLLEYAIKDEKYEDLHNVPLLAVADKTVGVFSNSGIQHYFLGRKQPKPFS